MKDVVWTKTIPSVPALVALWRYRRARLPGVTDRGLTSKELGQMKLLRNGLAEVAPNVIGWAITNWWQFSREAQASAGLSSAPENPHVGFLLAHYAVAVNMMHEAVPSEVETLLVRWRKQLEELLASEADSH